jgi:hypothetical protein
MSKGKRTFNHGDKETRLRTALRRLGTDDPVSLYGDERNPHALHVHHVAGREFSDETVHISLSDHGKISDAMKDHPPKIEGCTSPLESLGHLVLGLFELLGPAEERLAGHQLLTLMTYLRRMLWDMGITLIRMAGETVAKKAERGS